MDLLGGPAFRVAALEGVGARLAYYAALIALGFIAALRPRLTAWIGMGESVTNLTLLFLSILMPIWGLLDEPLGDGMPGAAGAAADPILFGPAQIGNTLLVGGMLILTFHRNKAAALGRARG